MFRCGRVDVGVVNFTIGRKTVVLYAARNDDRGKQLIAQTLAAYFKAVKESEGQAPRNACTKEALGGVRR